MNRESELQVQLLDRMAAGDAGARATLLQHLYRRIHEIARGRLNGFPRLRRQHDSASIADAAVLRVLNLEQVTTPTVENFLTMCGNMIGFVLLDIARKENRRRQVQEEGVGNDDEGEPAPVDAVPDRQAGPQQIFEGKELLERVAALPQAERDVVVLHKILNLSQPETAQRLHSSEKAISRLWLMAKAKLARGLQRSGHDRRAEEASHERRR